MRTRHCPILIALAAAPLVVTGASVAQVTNGMKTSDVNAALLVVSPVQQRVAGKRVGTASGFFYLSGDRLFFVTNRHVVIDEGKKIYPDELVLSLHTDPDDISKSSEYAVALSRNGKPTYLVHPKYPQTPIDIAVLPVSSVGFAERFVIKALSKEAVLPDDLLLSPGEDAMVIGYPLGVSDTVNNLPVIRGALLASAPNVFFQGLPCFLIDANLHPGTSGSPVMTRPRNDWPTKGGKGIKFMTGTPMYFLGVHSATLSVGSGSSSTPLGLGQVWHASLIEEIIAQRSAG